MRKPIFVRPLDKENRGTVEAGLRSSDAFTLRRSQIVLASSRGKLASRIAKDLSCDPDTVTNAINAFNGHGVEALKKGSNRPHTLREAFNPEQAEQLRALLHQSPRQFGKETSVWTLALAAEVSFERGLTAERVSGETVRATLVRLDVRWKRAKQWITSPDPEYARKKRGATI